MIFNVSRYLTFIHTFDKIRYSVKNMSFKLENFQNIVHLHIIYSKAVEFDLFKICVHQTTKIWILCTLDNKKYNSYLKILVFTYF